MLLDESRLFCNSKKLRFALIWERAAGGVCERREEEISWQGLWVVLEGGYGRWVDGSRNARGKQPNWETTKVSGTKRIFPATVLLSRASAGHWDLRKQYEISVTAEQKRNRRKKGRELGPG